MLVSLFNLFIPLDFVWRSKQKALKYILYENKKKKTDQTEKY